MTKLMDRRKEVKSLTSIVMLLALGLAACDKSGGGVEILSAEENFKVSVEMQTRPVDIVWVIDNSGSMQSSQQNLANNFNAFIQDFVSLKYDFQMVTTTTDTWFSQYNPNSLYSPRWRTGNRTGANPTQSGVYVMNQSTPALNSVFTTNALVGTNGNGDERAFASLLRSLNHAPNSDFRRNQAFLAVVIVSDEEDFSRTDSSFGESYGDPKLIPVADFISQLDTYTGATAETRRDKYQINSIYIKDAACLTALGNSTQKISTRYGEITDATGGVKACLCDPFNTVLGSIKDKILAASAVFKLERVPRPGTLVVKVNGVVIPEGPTTWSFDSAANTIRFSQGSVPAADATIGISYDPKTLL
jgi:hypothetical protein